MKPIIGIVGKSQTIKNNKSTIFVMDNYRKAILECGGIPILILPPQIVDYEKMTGAEIGRLTDNDIEILNKQLSLCSGILFQGGSRIFDYDKYICKYANDYKIPLLGVCLGMQIMCNYNNDNKNILNENPIHSSPNKDKVHEIKINESSNLFDIIKKDMIIVNSNHNYHVASSGDYKAVAFSLDGLIEAVEKDDYFNIGVQWHPEKKYKEKASFSLFKAFIDAAKKYKN